MTITSVGDTGKKEPPPEDDKKERLDFSTLELVLDEWVEGRKESVQELKAIEALNEELKDLNDLQALIGQLLAEVTQSGDSKKLKEVLDKNPGMLDRINALTKKLGFSPPLFKGGTVFESGPDVPPDIAALNEKDRTPYNINRLVCIQVLKDFSVEDPNAFRRFFKNKIGFDIEKLGKSNDKLENLVKLIKDDQWTLLVDGLFVKPAPDATKMDPPGYRVDPTWEKTDPGSMTWVVSRTAKLHQKQVERFNKVYEANLAGLLTTSHNGADLYGAQERIRARSTSLSNTMQSKSSEASQTVQENEGILKLIMNLMNEFSEAKKRFAS